MTVDGADLTPVLEQDPLDLRLSLTSIIHWADSREVRRQAMREIDFPHDDVSMFVVVNQIAYRGALRPTDLASTLGTTKANMSKIVRRLEDAGLVTRVPSPYDERSVLVALSPDGRRIGERIVDRVGRSLADSLATWSDDDVQVLRRVLAQFARQAMYELGQSSPAPRR